MEKQSVYTQSFTEDVGAFHEDALSASDAASSAIDQLNAGKVDAMMIDLLDGMRQQSMDIVRRKALGLKLV